MQSLRFLGHPAPKEEIEVIEGLEVGMYGPRSRHLEGAIKEAIEMLESSASNWPQEEQKYYAGFFTEKYGKEAFRRMGTQEYVVFLLRKTLGEVEQKK